jgi:hypothetical protein
MSTQPYQSVNPKPTLIWHGASGKSYEFEHFRLGAVTFNQLGGVYIFCYLANDSRWYAVYIGETDDFRRRLADELPGHHRWQDITRAGATHICALVVNGPNAAQRRLEIETDLRHKQNPPCNRQ